MAKLFVYISSQQPHLWKGENLKDTVVKKLAQRPMAVAACQQWTLSCSPLVLQQHQEATGHED